MENPVSLRLPPRLRERLAAFCERKERSRAWVIRKALTQYLDREETTPGAK